MFEIQIQALRKVYCRFCILLTVIFLAGVCLPLVTHGAADSFKVQTLIGSDITPPTIPTGLTASPVASSQINLSWASSTDDYFLLGYHVWRDDMQIATTTAPTYIDVGLSSSTLYTYYVTAFDSFFNFSASSTAVATTTLSPDVPSTESITTIFGSRVRPLADEIVSLEIVPSKDSVIIRYTTQDHIRSIVRWGRDTSYELGSLVSEAYLTKHETVLTGLNAGIRYSFTIEGENNAGRHGVLHTGTFTTLPPTDVFPPGNVADLIAVRDGSDVVLSWTNPSDPDLAKIRVVRNENFYPGDTADGWVVYEGLKTNIRDTEVRGDNWAYYTVFTYDGLGNISSGAVISVYLGVGEVPISKEVDPTENEIALTFEDLFFSQEGISIFGERGSVYLDGTKQFSIAIPYDRLPQHLKTVLVILGDSVDPDKTFSFLLRANSDKTEYRAILAPLGVSGSFPIQVAVFDFKTTQIGYSHGMVVSRIYSTHREEESYGIYGYIILGAFVFLMLILIGRQIIFRPVAYS